jgi:hypothetical protein
LLAVFLPAAVASPPLHSPGDAPVVAPSTRDPFYCQAPDFAMIYNMSSGFEAEIADDIPVEWAGYTVSVVTLWVGQWYSAGGPYWTDPVGVRLNLYHESCPPELVPFRTVEIAWDDLEKTLVFDTTGSTVYEVRIGLDPPLLIEDGMSLGTTALIDWGHEEPFTGIVATPFGVSYGACVAYLDAVWWGYERWTPIDFYTQIPQDLAYCLESTATAIPDLVTTDVQLTARPNPFNPRTTFFCTLSQSGRVTLRVVDLAGRAVVTLADRWCEAGEFSVSWDGRDAAGSRVPSAVYTAILQTPDGTGRAKVLLLE